MSRKAIIEKSVPKDFSDSQIQAEILEPAAETVLIGGAKIPVYPLSLFDARRFAGLASMVMASAEGPGNAIMRISGALNLDYAPRFMPFLAIATFEKPPNPDDDIDRASQIEKIVKDINAKITAEEMAAAFFSLLAQNQFGSDEAESSQKK